MQRLILTADQTNKLATATGSVDVVNAAGQSIGKLTLHSADTDQMVLETQVIPPEVWAEMKRHQKESAIEKGPNFKSRQVHDNA